MVKVVNRENSWLMRKIRMIIVISTKKSIVLVKAPILNAKRRGLAQ